MGNSQHVVFRPWKECIWQQLKALTKSTLRPYLGHILSGLYTKVVFLGDYFQRLTGPLP